MDKYVLLVVPSEGYSGIAYITFDVILKENSIDLVTASSVAGAVKSDDNSSSIMTMDFTTVLNHEAEFAGVVIIGGESVSDLLANPDLAKILTDLNSSGGLIVALDKSVKVLEELGISGNNVISSEGNYEQIAENVVSRF